MLVHLKQNGFGLRYGAHIEQAPPARSMPLWFDDSPEMFAQIQSGQPLVLGGEPGAGKSHIASDIFESGYASELGCFMLSCHINTSNLKGRETTEETFKTAQELGEESVIVLDNLDFAIYTGGTRRRRSNRQTAEYCDFISRSALQSLDAGCRILATVHSDAWRGNHSDALPETKNAYHTLISQLGGEQTFTGSMTAGNVERILGYRGIASSTAASIAGELHTLDELNFRNAYHINPDTYNEHGISAAVACVRAVMQQKIAGGA